MRACLIARGVVCLLAVVLCAAAAPAQNDAAKEFRKAKPKLQQKLRSKKVDDRVAAMEELKGFPTLDAAKLVVQVGLDDKAPEVKQAAYGTLLALRGEKEISDFLLQKLRETKRAGLTPESVPLVAAIAASPPGETQDAVVEALDAILGTNKADGHVVVLLVESLGEQGNEAGRTEAVLQALATLRKTKHYKKHFGFRRTVLQALLVVYEREAMDDLMALLPSLRGEMLQDAVAHLAAVSGRRHGTDAVKWAQWWQENREKFVFPEGVAAAVDPGAVGGLAYYGIPVNARRIVFILDTSASMVGPRLDAAKRELTNTIAALPKESYFGVVSFNTGVFVWQKDLLPATEDNKQQASSFISALAPTGTTSTFDAIQAGMGFDTEAIYLVTDGIPTSGKIVPPAGILDAVSRANRVSRFSIYTVGIAAQQASEFLRAIAGKNWGKFTEVQN
ncbi:MAG: VWA domain-containing protein [Planctomycetia bacterium]|nr:VWA domain-containing protein [Planctomycetia bacterium]